MNTSTINSTSSTSSTSRMSTITNHPTPTVPISSSSLPTTTTNNTSITGTTHSTATTINYSSQIIIHIDLDAFYAQVEIQRCKLDPTLPVAVQQWEGLIAVNYPARAKGISRLMRASDAKKICPELILVHVETLDKDGNRRAEGGIQVNDKVSLLRYREASIKIFNLLLKLCENNEKLLEKASVDEAYIDITFLVERYLRTGSIIANTSIIKNQIPLLRYTNNSTDPTGVPSDPTNDDEQPQQENKRSRHNTYTSSTEQFGIQAINDMLHDPQCYIITNNTTDYVGISNNSSSSTLSSDTPLNITSLTDARIAVGGLVARYIRQIIYTELGYTSSIGIAPNKMLAKLASTRHKPNAQTIIPISIIPNFMHRIPLTKIRFLGGLLGEKLLHEVINHGYASADYLAVLNTPKPYQRIVRQSRIIPNTSSTSTSSVTSNSDIGEHDTDDNEDGDPNLIIIDSDDEDDDNQNTNNINSNTNTTQPPSTPPPITAGQAQQLSLPILNKTFGEETGVWIYRILRGMDDSPITPRLRPKSMLAAKSFAPQSCRTYEEACEWLRMLSAELVQRMQTDEEAYHRQAKSLVLHYRRGDGTMRSRVGTMPTGSRTVENVLYAASLLLKKSVEEELSSVKSQITLVPHTSSSSSSSSSGTTTSSGTNNNGGGPMFKCSHFALAATNFFDTQIQGMSNITNFFQPKNNVIQSNKGTKPESTTTTATLATEDSDDEVQIISSSVSNTKKIEAKKSTSNHGIMAAFQKQQSSTSQHNTPERTTTTTANQKNNTKVSEIINLIDDDSD